jgi:DNA helicase INO80
MREGDFISLSYSTRSPIEYSIPELLYRDGGLVDVPHETSTSPGQSSCLKKLLNIWATDWIHQSLYDDAPSTFSFLRLLDLSPGEAHTIHVSPLIRRRVMAIKDDAWAKKEAPLYLDPYFCANSTIAPFRLSFASQLSCLSVAEGLPSLLSISSQTWAESCLSRSALKWFVPPVVAPAISVHCSDRTFLERQAQLVEGPLESLVMYGLPPNLREIEEVCESFSNHFHGLQPVGLVGNSPPNQLPLSKMQVPEAKRLIYDSAKLARLDALLHELKAGDHRVLVYFQMTRMMDIMEEYLIYRQYKYLRLDGSSKLEDRRDMVIDWQTRPDIFVFLLSTRAGGLGINLTAADTVVFYDHDWNPSNDAQAMDRAHRLGQTRQVTVYRLITKGTIDERIVQLARVKKDVQDIVVGNKNFTDVTKPSEIVQLLLNDDQLASLDTSSTLSGKRGRRPGTTATSEGEPIRDLWNDEGDDFFGHSAAAAATSNAASDPAVDDDKIAVTASRGKKRKSNASGATRARKLAGSKGKKKTAGNVAGDAIPIPEAV